MTKIVIYSVIVSRIDGIIVKMNVVLILIQNFSKPKSLD